MRERGSERTKDQVARSLNTSGRASPRDVFKQINSEPPDLLPVAGETSYTMCPVFVEIGENER